SSGIRMVGWAFCIVNLRAVQTASPNGTANAAPHAEGRRDKAHRPLWTSVPRDALTAAMMSEEALSPRAARPDPGSGVRLEETQAGEHERFQGTPSHA